MNYYVQHESTSISVSGTRDKNTRYTDKSLGYASFGNSVQH